MKISVALCTFNGEAFIEDQLTSIARQTRIPDEIVLRDDRSIDKTVEIARAVYACYGLQGSIEVNPLRLGAAQNFSQAMQRTTGDIIFLCDQDDVWLPEKVEKMLAPFEQDQTVSLVYSDGYIATSDLAHSGRTLFSWNPAKKLADGDARDIVGMLCQGNSPGIKGSAMAFTKWVRDLAGLAPENVAHDSWMALFGYAIGRVVAINEPLHSYRRHDKTSGRSTTNKALKEESQTAKTNQSQLLEERALLAYCLHERLEQITREYQGKLQLPRRFEEMKAAAQATARTLKARAEIVGSAGLCSRTFKAGCAFLRGDYCAIPDRKARVKAYCQDIGLASIKHCFKR